ncbi:hypothetical protein HB364_24880 [Pseudoflavitalea sp. X16]|uniref:hypothetical protein n=1 Tax=Paraflavitalea devenefica TaxID=2716334 RepID=UPI001422100E|nr:hypothetical protein [Paraflavitalea devenefica]NII28341.1 hypothetical protein [Paraflavitalea devenefica]
MKFSMVRASWVILVCLFIFSCGENTQQQDKTVPGTVADTIPDTASAKRDDDCDKYLIPLFERLTSEDTLNKLTDYEREITDINDIKSINSEFYKYTKPLLKIDTTERSKPRLSLAVDFNGKTLLEWMKKMDAAGANRLRIQFGVYTDSFLGKYLTGDANKPERDKRVGRLTTILVAYKISKNKDKEDPIGGYNLGGMQP